MDIETGAKRGALAGLAVGLAFGVVYAIGGFFVDLFTTGLNQGTGLAMLALIAMPLLGVPPGVAVGMIWAWFTRERA